MARTSEYKEYLFDGSAVRETERQYSEHLHKTETQNKNNVVQLSDKELRRSRRRAINPWKVFVTTLVLATILGISTGVVASAAQLTELTAEITQAKIELSELKSTQVQLEMKKQIENNDFDYAEHAREVLGMQRENPGQITYIHVANEDVGTVLYQESTWNRIVQKVKSWIE